mmetsp:Transcript_11381/g.26326  ORF Transcript_11381/g.26326 Transcript_11381/m.26326 type:complete len:318 (+) Transcript_11381:477-1430(+)
MGRPYGSLLSTRFSSQSQSISPPDSCPEQRLAMARAVAGCTVRPFSLQTSSSRDTVIAHRGACVSTSAWRTASSVSMLIKPDGARTARVSVAALPCRRVGLSVGLRLPLSFRCLGRSLDSPSSVVLRLSSSPANEGGRASGSKKRSAVGTFGDGTSCDDQPGLPLLGAAASSAGGVGGGGALKIMRRWFTVNDGGIANAGLHVRSRSPPVAPAPPKSELAALLTLAVYSWCSCTAIRSFTRATTAANRGSISAGSHHRERARDTRVCQFSIIGISSVDAMDALRTRSDSSSSAAAEADATAARAVVKAGGVGGYSQP